MGHLGSSEHHFSSLGAATGSKGCPLGAYVDFFMKFSQLWIAWRSSLGGTLEPAGSLFRICGVKKLIKFLDLFLW